MNRIERSRRVARAIVALGMASALLCCRQRPGPDLVSIVVPHEIDTLDPHARNALASFAVALNLYETLVTTDAEMRLLPSLAERWENPDLVTWVFHLRTDVRFHDGRLLDADDVVYSFRRLLGRHDLEVAGYLIYIADVEALDRRTVRVRTTRPLSILLNKIRFVAIVPKGSTDASLAAHPDGTGPYRFRSWKGRRLVLERNDGYWGRLPSTREVRIDLASSTDSALAAIRRGSGDLIQCNSRRISALVDAGGRYSLVRQPNIFVKFLGYDLGRDETPAVPGRRNPFKDPRVREALSIAIDRRRLVDGLPSYAVPASQLVPPFIFGFDPRITIPPVNVAGARALLAEAGYPDGFDVVLDTRRIFSDAAEAVRDQLSASGIRARLRLSTDPEFFARASRGDLSFYLSRFGCTTGDISDILDNVLHSPDPVHHFGIHNWQRYASPDVDQRIEESAGIYGVGLRRAVLQEITTLAMSDRVWVPLFVDDDVYAVRRGLVWKPRNDGMILAAEIGTGAGSAPPAIAR